MAKSSGITDRLYWNGDDVSGDIGSLQRIGAPRNLLEVTAINSTTVERINGLGSGEIQFNAWFNDDGAANRSAAAGSTHHNISQLPTTDVLLLYARGATIGNPCYALTALQASHDMNRGADGALSFGVNMMGNGVAGEWGVMLTAGQHTFSSSAASPPTGVVDAAQTSLGGIGFLQFQSRASGTPTFLIQDSNDTTNGVNGTWATLLTFANTGGTSSFGERKTVTGTVDKGIRCGTPTGTYSNAIVAVGFRRGVAGDDVSLA